MEQLSKIVTRQDANFKLSPSPSNETSINLSKEISALISDDSGEVTFMLYKSDFIKALAALCIIPQIYLKKNQDPSSVSDIFASLSNEIAAQFDKSETAPYTVYLFKRDDGRAYFNNLKQDNGFNLRAFLVEKYSTLTFIKNDNGTLSIRLNTSVPDEALLKEEPLIPDEELAPLDEPLQQIFYGAPGTGKSHTIEQMCSTYENYRTTFHPDTDYASFVGSYKPITVKTDVRDMAGHIVYENGKAVKESRIDYRYVMQAFLKAYVAAWREQQNDEPKPVFLIVEEINRGNCAQIFGDIFQLLDRNAAGFSDYPIVADDDLAQELKEILGEFSIAKHDAINALYSGGKDVIGMVKNGECLLLPNNMYIWATMNTSDQSLFPIDSAFKRRWDWNYIKIKDAGENFKIVFSNGNTYDWWKFVSSINERIEGGEIQQEDKKLGYFFAKAKDKVITPKVLLSKVLFYLYNDVFKDFGLDEDFFKDENGETMSFASYFDNNGQINENRVERFVTNLGLEPLADEQAEEAQDKAEIEEDRNDDGSSNKLTIRFLDGTVVKEPTRFESFKKALEIIGLDKVEPIAAEKKYMRRNSALVSISESPEILADPVYSYVKSGDYYIVKGTNTRTQRNLLNLISDRLNLGLKVTVE